VAGHPGPSLDQGVAQRVLVRARPGARVLDALAEVTAARGGSCAGLALLSLAPRFGVERIEVRGFRCGRVISPACMEER
jgi:hypothetical protein